MSKISKIKDFFGLRDFFVFGGMGMLGYGLWQINPVLTYTVCGSLLMLLGFVARGR